MFYLNPAVKQLRYRDCLKYVLSSLLFKSHFPDIVKKLLVKNLFYTPQSAAMETYITNN